MEHSVIIFAHLYAIQDKLAIDAEGHIYHLVWLDYAVNDVALGYEVDVNMMLIVAVAVGLYDVDLNDDAIEYRYSMQSHYRCLYQPLHHS